MDYTDREAVKGFLKENDIRDLAQLNGFIKEMTGVMIEEMLDTGCQADRGSAGDLLFGSQGLARAPELFAGLVQTGFYLRFGTAE